MAPRRHSATVWFSSPRAPPRKGLIFSRPPVWPSTLALYSATCSAQGVPSGAMLASFRVMGPSAARPKRGRITLAAAPAPAPRMKRRRPPVLRSEVVVNFRLQLAGLVLLGPGLGHQIGDGLVGGGQHLVQQPGI